MALFFNVQTLEEQAAGDSNKLLAILEYHWNKKVPKNLRVRFFPAPVSLAGHSFILNPSAFFAEQTDPLFKVQFIKLAGLRDYNLYKQYKYARLNTSYFPDIRYDVIKYNPLITVTPTEIIFKNEERN